MSARSSAARPLRSSRWARAAAVAWIVALASCRTAAPPSPSSAAPSAVSGDAGGARALAEAFLQAAERGDHRAVWKLLAPELRARYVPERLAADFAVEPLAKERLARVRAALDQGFTVRGDQATLALGAGRAFVLVKEQGAWRVAALE